jgi:hypothetical protein
MSVESLLTVLAIVAALALAWFLDRRLWARKSVDELERMVWGSDWRGWKNGMLEFQRRGIDNRRFIPALLPRLLDESQFSREGARIALVDMFPEMREQLRTYRSSDPPAVSRAKLGALLQQHGLGEAAV